MISYENRCALLPLRLFFNAVFFLLQIIPPPQFFFFSSLFTIALERVHKWVTDAGLYFKIQTVTVSEIK